MKKLLTGMFFAAVTFFSVTASADHHSPRWGVFTNSTNIEVDSGDPIPWLGFSTESDGITTDSTDSSKIVIEHSGVYIVNYILTLEGVDFGDTDAQFALFLNEGATPVPGSTFAIADIGSGDIDNEATFIRQLVGQAIVHVTRGNSTLQLFNWSPFDVELISDIIDTNPWGDNVSASLLIQRVDPHSS